MKLEEYQQTWQRQTLPQLDEKALLAKTEGLAAKISQQNRKVSFTLLGTIAYLLVIGGIFFHDNLLALTLVGLVIVLLAYQTMVFRRRELAVADSLEAQPVQYLDSMIQKLRYNLRVSKLHMPIYGILLGSLIGIYTWVVLGPTSDWIKALAIGGMLLIMAGIFVWGMRRQGRKDRDELIPLLAELEAMKADFEKEV
ncbi:MAG: hypothetical protein AAF927_11075 [Bacteroidota bacterium]